MKTEGLIRLQIELEYRVEGNQLFPFPGSTEHARFITYRFKDGYARYYRFDLPRQLRQELEQLDPGKAFQEPERVVALLNAHSRSKSFGLFESCYFTQIPQASDYPLASGVDNHFEVQVNGQPVSLAWSERSNEHCVEVAVETEPKFQRRGYARQAVSALAAYEMGRGKVVFYSYKMDNLPSGELGRRLGVVHFASCAAYD